MISLPLFSNVSLELLLNTSVGPPGLGLSFVIYLSISYLLVFLTILLAISSNLTSIKFVVVFPQLCFEFPRSGF